MVTQPRRNCSSAQSTLRDSLSGFIVNLRSPESAFNSFHYLSWQPMESSEKRAKKGYKKIDLGFNSEHKKEKMVWELHLLFKLMGKQQKPDRRWEWRQLWRREESRHHCFGHNPYKTCWQSQVHMWQVSAISVLPTCKAGERKEMVCSKGRSCK